MKTTTPDEIRDILAAQDITAPVFPGCADCKSATPAEAAAYFDACFAEMSEPAITPKLRAAIEDKERFARYLGDSTY